MNELFEEYQEFRKILCVCPCCGEIVRVSDLKLQVKGKSVKTWLDIYDAKEQKMDEKEAKFAEIQDKLRELAVKKGRKQAEKVINNALMPSFRALKYNPFDVKPLLNPVDFIVFCGMDKLDCINNIVFLSKQHDAPNLINSRKQIEKAILCHKYEWKVARVDDEGSVSFE